MATLFVSYSRRDSRTVDSLVARLAEDGHSAWIDREGIDGGAQWRATIVKAINAADVVLLVLTADSAASDNVRRELDIAQDSPARIVPIQFGAVTVPDAMAYQLAGVQIIDMTGDREAGYQRLLAVLGAGQPRQAPRETRQTGGNIEAADLSSLGGGGFFSRLFGKK